MKPIHDWGLLRGRTVVIETNEGSTMRGRVRAVEVEAVPLDYVGDGAELAEASLGRADALVRPADLVFETGDRIAIKLVAKLRVVDEGFKPAGG
jgi:hypothetical protein